MGVLVWIGLFGVVLLRMLSAVAQVSDGAPPINLPPGFVANVFAADLGTGLSVTVSITLAQFEYLRRIGCDFGQGHYFSAPKPASELVGVSLAVPEKSTP